MRGGVLVRNLNDFRSETDSASFMHYDATARLLLLTPSEL